jgi:hypothetical protein
MCTFEDQRLEQARAESFEAGRKAERAAIVQYLREDADSAHAPRNIAAQDRCDARIRILANSIEEGEHAEGAGCKRCGKPVAYPGAVYCGAACSAQAEGGHG